MDAFQDIFKDLKIGVTRMISQLCGFLRTARTSLPGERLHLMARNRTTVLTGTNIPRPTFMQKETTTAEPFVPEVRSLPVLRKAVQQCRGCDLYRNATQAVFGEIEEKPKAGQRGVAVMMIGEQPGDKEDIEGRPFVGPAGKLLDQCLEEASIERSQVYVTNAVKHFKWEPRGKRRIHEKPNMREIKACRPWLDAEIETVTPKLIVCLGATAAQALLGSSFKVTKQRGTLQHIEGLAPIIATVHPSSILRAQTDEDRQQEMTSFITDLKRVSKYLKKTASS
jgi:uracil-DNA glycosylase family protein